LLTRISVGIILLTGISVGVFVLTGISARTIQCMIAKVSTCIPIALHVDVHVYIA